MVKKIVLYFLFICVCTFISAQNEQDITPEENKEVSISKEGNRISFGVKTGFNSTSYLISEFQIEGIGIKEIQNNYKIGYHVTTFMRINFKKHFIQPELSYQINRSELSFDKSQNTKNGKSSYATIESKIHHIELPILYGFNFINKNPYGFSFFIGPKIAYLWKKKSSIEFNNFDLQDIEEKIEPFNIGAVAGVAVNISKIFFDFRYEQSFLSVSKEVKYTPSTVTQNSGKTLFNRRESVISFSVGFMF